MAIKFTPRFEKPETGNKYYITKSSGGYSPCIIGKPTDACNVLANCVGYAVGRFNEIGGYNCCKYLASTNAENMANAAKNQGLTVSDTPTLGGCMVWAKGKVGNSADGAGHVAIVEQINADGTIITSESGYNANKPFWTQKRQKIPNWGESSEYTYIGCIVNPAVQLTVYRVQTGAFYSRELAEKYASDLKKQGIDCFIVECLR